MGKKISGMKCKVFIGSPESKKILAGQRGATLNRTSETIDATSKDTEGLWTETIPGMKSWGIDCDGCYIADDAAYEELETAYLEGTPVPVAVEMENGDIHHGEATISDFSLDIPYDDVVSYSLSLQGNGALNKRKQAE